MPIEIISIGLAFRRWDELLELIRQSFAYMNDFIDPPSSALLLTVLSLQEKSRGEFGFVALDGDLLVGCVFCRAEPPSGLYIGKLAVAPDHQGQGIGKQLLCRTEDLARSLGYRELRLETRIELTDNHERFAAMGFSRTAETSHAGFDRVTSVEMRKRVEWSRDPG